MTKFGPNITAKQKLMQSTLLICSAIATALLISSIVIVSNPRYARVLEKTLKSDYLTDSLSLSRFFAHRSDENEISSNDVSPGDKESLEPFMRINMSLVPEYETTLSHHQHTTTANLPLFSGDSKKSNLLSTIDTSDAKSSLISSTHSPSISVTTTSMTTSDGVTTVSTITDDSTRDVHHSTEVHDKNSVLSNAPHVSSSSPASDGSTFVQLSSPSNSSSEDASRVDVINPLREDKKESAMPSGRPMTSTAGTTGGSERVNETVKSINSHDNYDPNLLKSEIITAIDAHLLAPFDDITGSHVSVQSKLGKIRGIQATIEGKLVNAFLGIPYAEAPVGDLRFRKTVKLSRPWTGTLDATKFKPHCPQHFDLELVKKRSPTTNLMTEDCLHLNIWAPGEVTDGKLKPVMVWVFGGGFSGGSGNLDEFDGRILTALGDVVVINFNYRVGSLGFLDLSVADSPGNQGLYDMKECLLWIKENIEHFGGDPNQVTLVGQSAGAISIGLLMVNDHSSKLFSRAILQSGSPVMLNFFFSRNEETADKFIRYMNCSHAREATNNNVMDGSTASDGGQTSPDDSSESDYEQRRQSELNCLKSKSISQVIEAQKNILESSAFPFTPEPYEQFLPFMATEALRADIGSKMYKETFNHVNEILIGTNADEASVILHMEVPEIFALDEIKLNITSMSQLRDLVTTNLSREFSIDPPAAAIFSSLFLNRGPEIDTTENLIRKLYQVLGDLAFICPVNSLVEGLTERGKSVFQYVFDYRSSASPWGKWMGVTHGDEYIFTFGHPLRYPDRYSKEDRDMSRRMVHAWTHFAKHGKVPNQLGKKWPKFTARKGEYMKLRSKSATVGRHLDSEICTLFKIGLETYGTRRRREVARGSSSSLAMARQVERVLHSMAKFSLL